jgi:hypothetical protein
MSLNAKAMLIALVPNAMFVCALFGWMAGRLSAGGEPFPHGWAPFIMPLTVIVPMASVMAGNVVRMIGQRPQ